KIIGHIETACGKKARVTHASARQGDISRSVIDAKKAQKMLNWRPETMLREGIKETVHSL
nr:GDP-mannose 4,6-dehydratase [Patescibacteria group bacterium]